MKAIIACTPTNANQQLASWGESFRYSPGIDYTLTRCENVACGTEMWMGPRQKAAYEVAPGSFVRLCSMCAVQASPGGAVVQMSPVDSPRRMS